MHHQDIFIRLEPIKRNSIRNLPIWEFGFPNWFLLFSHVTMGSPSVIDVTALSDAQNLSFSGHLTVNSVPARRSKAPAMSGAVAAFVSSDMFKTPVCICYLRKVSRNLNIEQGLDKPKAKRWDRRFILEYPWSETRKSS